MNPWIVTCPNCKKEHEAAEVIMCDCGVSGGIGKGMVGRRMGFVWVFSPVKEHKPDPKPVNCKNCGFRNYGLSKTCFNCQKELK